MALTARRHGGPYTVHERERLQRAADMVGIGRALSQDQPRELEKL